MIRSWPRALVPASRRAGRSPLVRALVALSLLGLSLLAAPAVLGAQKPTKKIPRRDSTATRRPGEPQRPQRVLGAGDTSATDTTRGRRGEIVKWAEQDSVMAALLARPGYQTTVYQGNAVVFDVAGNELLVEGEAAVKRGETILASDTISFNDSTKLVRAAAAANDTSILRDPAQGDDILSRVITYNVAEHTGTVSELSTSVEQSQRWFVSSGRGGFVQDTATGQQTFYILDGDITSCDLKYPHYHFAAQKIKLVSKNIMVARSAVLYIADIPVLWLPFIFQDMRAGRHSGILPPRVGVSDIVRASSQYRRQIENLGYYFAFSDYADAEVSLDWRSGAHATLVDPGWTRYNGDIRYRWLDRFLSGDFRVSYSDFTSGNTNTALSWSHQQEFSQKSRLNMNINYVSSTTLQRQQAVNIAQALATIASQLNFANQIGPASFQIGGSRRQYPGRSQVDQEFPSLNVTTKPITAGDWLSWTPSLALTNQQVSNMDAPGGDFGFRYFVGPGGRLDSSAIRHDTRQTNLSFNTPVQLFGFNWRNSFTVNDLEHDFPEQRTIVTIAGQDTTRTTRVYSKTFLTSIDYNTGIDLPRISQGRLNIVPSVQISNVDPHGYFVRSERTGGTYVHQAKRLSYGATATPTLFGFFPGFGPFERIRHSITPSISYSYAPAARVSEEFLNAIGSTSSGYLGNLAQNQVTLGLTQSFEAKLRNASDTNPNGGEKIRLLQLSFSPVTYDFERARQTHGSGFSTSTFQYSARSDLLPGFDVSVGYSLFQGDPLSDTARFKPFRTSVSTSLHIGRASNPFTTLTRLFGRAVPPDSATVPAASAGGEQIPDQLSQSPSIAGTSGGRNPLGVDATQGWQATLSFSSFRQRPPVGGGQVVIFDPRQFCEGTSADPILFEQCIQAHQQPPDTLATTTAGGVFTRIPATSTLRGSFTFNMTPQWAVQWTTGYDFSRSEFSDHMVTLQRKMHDWRAIWAFTQAPNGNFAFNFFIALNAEPDLKFNYDRRTYRSF